MKGLVYKDILILVKQLKFALFMVAIFCLIPNDDFGLNRFFLLYSGLFLPITLFAIDEATRWENYAAMLPCSLRDIVLSRYVLGWLGLAFGGVFFAIGTFLPFGGKGGLLPLIMVVGCALLFQGIIFPLLFRFGPNKGRLVSILAIVVMAVVVWTLYDILDSIGLVSATGGVLWLILVLGAVVCAASIPVSVRLYAIRRG